MDYYCCYYYDYDYYFFWWGVSEHRSSRESNISSTRSPSMVFALCEPVTFDLKTISLVGYPYTKFEDFGIICFWVMLRTNRQTDTQTGMDECFTPATIVGVSNKRMYGGISIKCRKRNGLTGRAVKVMLALFVPCARQDSSSVQTHDTYWWLLTWHSYTSTASTTTLHQLYRGSPRCCYGGNN